MKNVIITMCLTLVTSSALASVDPLVSEYQKIDGLQKAAPSLAETLIAVNARTATGCNLVAPLDLLIKFDEVAVLAYMVNEKGRMDGSDEMTAQLDKATIAVCQSLLSEMVGEPKEVTELQKELRKIDSKYALSAIKRLSADYNELRNKYLKED